MTAPDPQRMRKAVADFLQAAGLSLRDPNLKETPKRVAEAWVQELISGYGKDPRQVLGPQFNVVQEKQTTLVVVTGIHYRSLCPHHLMPYEGYAHVAYVPNEGVVGFGRLAALVDMYASRLTLQETLASEVAQALKDVLRSRGAACVLEAHQSCFRLRSSRQHQAVTHTESYQGVLASRAALRKELWTRIAAHTPTRQPEALKKK